ncbi:hypothetical protein C2W59_01403 [Bacillus pumilus]|uniref:class I SAM-dependent methyltransferase n=1 Tax=Bacillus pumilus TaxID=1408 RepID=UPI000DC22AAF|nr:class I SAM-dependent methyltransferase [Bacillus pumilus]RAP18981.1 hypothetical protein C2W59_01403 [Bacillus pumilus]
MVQQIQQYDNISSVYDKLIPEPDGLFDFYSGFVKEGITILDIGCGSGRLAFQLAQNGATVHAIDISAGMVENAKRKLATSDQKTLERIHFEKADIKNFHCDSQFDYIFMSGGVFEYLLTPNDQVEALKKIKQLLKPEGKFIFDIISPPQVCPYDKRQKDFGNTANPSKDHQYINSQSIFRIDHYKQIVSTYCLFEIHQGDKATEKYEFKFLTRYSLPTELFYLLKSRGFTVLDFYGDYNREPFKRGSEFMIYITKLS